MRPLVCTPFVVASLAGCLELAAGTSSGGPDAGPALANELGSAGTRPPDRAPIELPDCGSFGWDSGAALGGDPLAAAADAGGAFLPGADGGSIAPGASAARGPGAVVLSEVMSDPNLLSDTQGEWIELHNPTDRVVDLQGCLIDDGGTARLVAEPLPLAPGGHVTIARAASPGFVPDLVMPMSLGNDGDVLVILCDGVEIDRVVYGPGFPLGAGASMSLDPGSSDAASNDAAGAWCFAETSYAFGLGTPGSPNPPCPDEGDGGV